MAITSIKKFLPLGEVKFYEETRACIIYYNVDVKLKTFTWTNVFEFFNNPMR